MLRIATLGYHEVTDDPSDSGFQRPLAWRYYKHTRCVFRQHLDAIAAARLTPELVTALDFRGDGDRLMLTFDDGGKSALYIAEELCRRQWHAHFMIATALVGTRTFLSRSEIVSLRQLGHVVGSHSHTHPDIFKDLSFRAMVWQWRTSCDTLAQILGEPCTVASLPGGDLSTLVTQSASAAGIDVLFTSEPWLNPKMADGCRLLGRVCIKAGTPAARVHQFATLRGWSSALVARRCSVMLRSACPPLYRAYVRRQTRQEGGSL